MHVASVTFVSLLAGVFLGAASAADDGVGVKPLMGWRDWNQYGGDINQEIMLSTMYAVAAPFAGTNVSLKSLGFLDVGLDDVWQRCGSYGPLNWTYHDADGSPVVDTDRFPNMSALPATAHALGLTAGFYGNNCACSDHCTDLKCFLGDVNAVVNWGFDSLKLDGCGKQENIALWWTLFNWTLSNIPGAKPVLLENCHNGPHSGSPAALSPFGPYVPTRDWCPFHMYRSSGDIRPQWGSILSNLQTIPPLAAANLSRPGCWAYPVSPSRPRRKHTRIRAHTHNNLPHAPRRTCWKWAPLRGTSSTSLRRARTSARGASCRRLSFLA